MSNRRLYFTLIELLVVIAIIAILAAMLLPVLGKAKGDVDRRFPAVGGQYPALAAIAHDLI